MSNSLRDQLKKVGLVSKNAAPQKKKRGKKPRQQELAKSTEARQREAEIRALDAHKRDRDRALNEQREKQRRAREQADWVRQLAKQHAVNKEQAEEGAAAFHFTLDTKVHHFYPSAAQRKSLSAGRMGVLFFDGEYQLLPDTIIRRLQEKVPKRVWLAEPEPESPDDDPYADFKVPDDLMW